MISENTLVGAHTRTRPIKNELEQQLVQRACQGDAQAFGQLYELSVDRVYRYIFFRVSDDETAEDLTSRVFLKAWEHMPDFKPRSVPFIAWLYTISHNAVIDHYRLIHPTASLDEALYVPSDDLLPEEECERHTAAHSLRRALQQLTAEQGQVVTMKLLDGMSTDEIAARLHKSPGAIRALQMRAYQALARIYQAEKERSATGSVGGRQAGGR